jgi:hypothetical protein
MYDFLFYFTYKQSSKRDGEFVARFLGRLVVLIGLSTLFGFFYSILRFSLCYFWGVSIARTNARPTPGNNLTYFGIILLIFGFVNVYFNKTRVDKIIIRYDKKKGIYSAGNIIKYIVYIFIPLVLGIILINKSVLYCE